MRRTTAAALGVALALSLAVNPDAFDRPEPELVAVGEDVEQAHSLRDCRRYGTATWGWTTRYESTRYYQGAHYVLHWHQPTPWNVFARAHHNVSKCQSRELRYPHLR